MNVPARTAALWSLCLAFALGLHVAGAYALLARWHDAADMIASAPAILVELAPIPAAPSVAQTQLSDGPPLPQAEVQPESELIKSPEAIAAQPAPQAELQMTPPPKPVEKVKEKKPKQKHASIASAPKPAERKAEQTAAMAPGATAGDPNALPNWKSQLVARLERFKRYPPEAEARGDSGIAQLAFSVDRKGGVHHARIVRSSGSSTLDAATLALAERAAPLPPPPPEVIGAQIAVTVPIRYNFR